MKPPYILTGKIWELVTAISERIGAINANHLYKPTTELRKKNRIKTIQSSLEIEGNTLTEEQITALLENKRVLAPRKDIIEVQNAIRVYEQFKQFNPYRLADLEKAHAILMDGLIDQAGKLRTTNVGIVKGSKVQHIAPGGSMVRGLMKFCNPKTKHFTQPIGSHCLVKRSVRTSLTAKTTYNFSRTSLPPQPAGT